MVFIRGCHFIPVILHPNLFTFCAYKLFTPQLHLTFCSHLGRQADSSGVHSPPEKELPLAPTAGA